MAQHHRKLSTVSQTFTQGTGVPSTSVSTTTIEYLPTREVLANKEPWDYCHSMHVRKKLIHAVAPLMVIILPTTVEEC